jgi:N-methylhydantoinase A
VAAIGRRAKPAFAKLEARKAGAPTAVAHRQVYFAGGGFVDCPVYERSRLLAGDRFAGPAIVEEPVATTLLDRGDTAEVASDGCIVITIG